jgi:hypothetical protein
VFSGEGVSRLREYLKRLAEDQEREGRISRDESGGYSEVEGDSSRETISDDGTIDAADEVAERRTTLLPRPDGYRSYADVVSGSVSNSPDREDADGENEDGIPIPRPRSSRVFRRRSSRPGSSTEHDGGTRYRGYLTGDLRREASRSVSEGQGSSSRLRFTHSEVPAFDDYFPAIAETQNRRPLPPRPHWPPQAQTAQFFDGEQQVPAPGWSHSSGGPSSRDLTRATDIGSPAGHGDIHYRDDSRATAIYDTDEDEVEIAPRPQPSRRHADIDGEMES